ncbi:hypothetical protein D3C72_625580 [compost metagenome]
MLLSFSIENYLSFRKKITLDMSAEALKEKKGHLHVPYLYNPKLHLLKSISIFGYNSYGKSNLLKGYSVYRNLILKSFSFSGTSTQIPVEPFKLNTSSLNNPNFFESIFILKNTKYRYGFKIKNNAIIEEWLFYADGQIRENVLFYRNGQEMGEISKIWNKESNGMIEKAVMFTQPQSLFLSVLLSQNKLPPRVDEILQWFQGNIILSGNYTDILNSNAPQIYTDLEFRSTILKFIDASKLGFESVFEKISEMASNRNIHQDLLDIAFEDKAKNFELFTKHNVFDENYNIVSKHDFNLQKSESSGTIKYFILACFLSLALKRGQLIWIDELDSSLDSNLFVFLIETFNSVKNNVAGSQLVFITHNTAIMNKKLRRDQIYLVDKNEYGESSLHPAHTTKNPIRINKSIESEYRDGLLNEGKGSAKNKLTNDIPTLFDDLENNFK